MAPGLTLRAEYPRLGQNATRFLFFTGSLNSANNFVIGRARFLFASFLLFSAQLIIIYYYVEKWLSCEILKITTHITSQLLTVLQQPYTLNYRKPVLA